MRGLSRDGFAEANGRHCSATLDEPTSAGAPSACAHSAARKARSLRLLDQTTRVEAAAEPSGARFSALRNAIKVKNVAASARRRRGSILGALRGGARMGALSRMDTTDLVASTIEIAEAHRQRADSQGWFDRQNRSSSGKSFKR